MYMTRYTDHNIERIRMMETVVSITEYMSDPDEIKAVLKGLMDNEKRIYEQMLKGDLFDAKGERADGKP